MCGVKTRADVNRKDSLAVASSQLEAAFLEFTQEQENTVREGLRAKSF